MTNELRAVLDDAVREFEYISYGLKQSRIWGGASWNHLPLHPDHYLHLTGRVEKQIKKLSALLAEQLPPSADFVEPVCFLRETSWSYVIAPWDDLNGFPVYATPRKRQWRGLTVEEKTRIRDSVPYTQFMSAGEYAMQVQDATEAELREKNT